MFENPEVVTVITSVVTAGLFILMNVSASIIKKRFNITTLSNDEIKKNVDDMSQKDQIRDMLIVNLLKSLEKTGEMVATAYMGSKLDPGTKKEIIKNWSDMEKLFNDADMMLTSLSDNLVNTSIEQIKARNEMLGKLAARVGPTAKEYIGDAISQGTSYLESLTEEE